MRLQIYKSYIIDNDNNFYQKKAAMIRKYIYNRGQNEKNKKIFTKWWQAFPAVHANWSSQKL